MHLMIPAELINNFIRCLNDQLCELITEMHMTEFCSADRQMLNSLVKHLDEVSHEVAALALYKINKNDKDLELAFTEADHFRDNVHEMILTGEIDPKLIETLQKANSMLEELKKGKNNYV